jgi:HlyD family secretion protein
MVITSMQANANVSRRKVCGMVAWLGMCMGVASPAVAQSDVGIVAVEVSKPKIRMVKKELTLPGSVVADLRVDLFAKTSGYVFEINVDIGDSVKKGDPVVELSVPEMADQMRQAEAIVEAKRSNVQALQANIVQARRLVDTARAQVERQRAQLNLEELNLNRMKKLRDGNAISEQVLDEARSAFAIANAQLRIELANVAGAKAEILSVESDARVSEAEVGVALARVDHLRTMMRYATVRAPFDGVVTMRWVDPGSFVRSAEQGAATKLVRIMKIDRVRVVMEVPESDSRDVRVGAEVLVSIPAGQDEPIVARVSRMASALNSDTRTMRVEADVDNSSNRLPPGSFVYATLVLRDSADAVVIPSKAIRDEGETSTVLVNMNGVAKRRVVVVGYDDGIWAQIVKGLDGTESVITSSGGTVGDGSAVKPVATDS